MCAPCRLWGRYAGAAAAWPPGRAGHRRTPARTGAGPSRKDRPAGGRVPGTQGPEGPTLWPAGVEREPCGRAWASSGPRSPAPEDGWAQACPHRWALPISVRETGGSHLAQGLGKGAGACEEPKFLLRSFWNIPPDPKLSKQDPDTTRGGGWRGADSSTPAVRTLPPGLWHRLGLPSPVAALSGRTSLRRAPPSGVLRCRPQITTAENKPLFFPLLKGNAPAPTLRQVSQPPGHLLSAWIPGLKTGSGPKPLPVTMAFFFLIRAATLGASVICLHWL